MVEGRTFSQIVVLFFCTYIIYPLPIALSSSIKMCIRLAYLVDFQYRVLISSTYNTRFSPFTQFPPYFLRLHNFGLISVFIIGGIYNHSIWPPRRPPPQRLPRYYYRVAWRVQTRTLLFQIQIPTHS
jgi:hypothetical protein